MFGTILCLYSSEPMLVLVRDLPFLPFFQLFILLLFFIYLKKELKIFLFLFQFCFFHLLMIVFLFLRRKVMKNQIQIFFVVTILFLLFSTNSVWLSNMTNQRFFYFSRSTKNVNPPLLDLSPIECYNYLLISTA